MDTDRERIFSERLSTKSRTYFFDVKVSSKGAAYLSINESRKREGKFEHSRVLVFEDNLDGFRQALDKVSQFVQSRPR